MAIMVRMVLRAMVNILFSQLNLLLIKLINHDCKANTIPNNRMDGVFLQFKIQG